MTVERRFDESDQADDSTAATRAEYVVGRLSDAVPGPTEKDWAQVKKELHWAYSAIDDAQRGNLVRTAARRTIGLLLTYAVVVAFQWQVDSLWAARGFSARVFYLPALTPVIAVLVVVFAGGLYSVIDDIVSFDDYFDPTSWLMAIVPGGLAAGGFYAIMRIFDYTWPQAVVLTVAESLIWTVGYTLSMALAGDDFRSAADPRDQLLGDLVTFLAVAAVPLAPVDDTDWRASGWSFPPVRWHGDLYSPAEAARRQRRERTRQRREQKRTFRDPVQWANSREATHTEPRDDSNQGGTAEDSQVPEDPLPHIMRIDKTAWRWRNDRQVRRAFAEGIVEAANGIEFNLPKVAGRRETAVRWSVRQTSTRIGATLRSYAADVMLGGAEPDQDLAPRMSAAVVSAAWGRWQDLAIEEPTPPVERFLKRFGSRIVVAAILVAMAIFLPVWLHQWIGDGALQFRIALITAAVLGLTEAPRSAVERVAGFLQQFSNRSH